MAAKRPVFVVGCPRSGTTLVYSMLVAAGGFAVYRKETFIYALASRFPTLTSEKAREQFTREFLSGYLGRVPGLDVEPIARAVVASCERPADFLARLMDAITQQQGMDRWIEATPAHVLHIDAIKQAVPDALVVHVIRDGRDCALSIDRQGWLPACPWDRRIAIAALYWEWMVRAGRKSGRTIPQDYLEVRFEDVIGDPHTTLSGIGRFIDHDLDYDCILQNRVHALDVPNTSFRDDARDGFMPVGRWRAAGSTEDVRVCEAVTGRMLEELGYTLAYPNDRGRQIRSRLSRSVYLNYFAAKHWIKVQTPLGPIVTSTSVWAEQPRAGERPVRAIRSAATAAVPPDAGAR